MNNAYKKQSAFVADNGPCFSVVEICTVLRLAIQINSTALPGDQNTSITAHISTEIPTNGIAAHILALHRGGVGVCSAIKGTQMN